MIKISKKLPILAKPDKTSNIAIQLRRSSRLKRTSLGNNSLLRFSHAPNKALDSRPCHPHTFKKKNSFFFLKIMIFYIFYEVREGG